MFSNVLVGVDGMEGGRDAIALARRLVASDARITLAHIYRDFLLGRAGAPLLPAQHQDAERLLAHERELASVKAETVACLAPSVGRGLHGLARREGSELLVVGSCSREIAGRLLTGDDTQAALNGAPCPVAIATHGYRESDIRSRRSGSDTTARRRVSGHSPSLESSPHEMDPLLRCSRSSRWSRSRMASPWIRTLPTRPNSS